MTSDFPNIWLVVTGMAIHGTAIGAQYLPGLIEIKHVATARGWPSDDQTAALSSGLWNIAISLGSSLGPIISGVLFDNIGFTFNCVIITLLNGIFGVFVLIVHFTSKNNQREKQPLLS